MKEFVKQPKKNLKKITQADWTKYVRRCQQGPFSPFATFFLELRGLKIYLDNEPVEVYELFNAGFRDAGDIIEGKTKYEARMLDFDKIKTM